MPKKHAIRAYGSRRVKVLRIIDVGTRWW